MRRMLALSAAAILLVPAAVAAQSAVGVHGGMTLSSISVESDEVAGFESKAGIVFGALVQFPIGETFALQLGLNYTEKGGDASGTEEGFGLDLVYLEVPVLAVWRSSGATGVRLMAGPVVSFRFSCRQRGVGGVDGSLDCAANSFVTNSNDYGFQVGGGVISDVGESVSLFVDASYNYGFTNWRADAGLGDTARNRTALLTAGAIFQLP